MPKTKYDETPLEPKKLGGSSADSTRDTATLMRGLLEELEMVEVDWERVAQHVESEQELEDFRQYRRKFEEEETKQREKDELEEREVNTLKFTAFRGMCGTLSEDKTPLMNLTLEGKRVVALMDSGASHCIISQDFCDKFPNVRLDTSKKLKLSQLTDATDAVGTVKLKLRWVGGYKKQMFIVIPKSMQEVILGRDILRDAEIVTDLSKGVWTSVQAPGENIPFTVTCMRVELTPKDWEGVVSNSKCPVEFQPKLTKILAGNLDTFKFTAGSAKGVTHVINNGDHRPYTQKFRPMNPAKIKILNELINDYIRKGIIRKSKSPWAANIVLVTNKDGTLRPCVDFREMNERTVADQYPMQNVEDIFMRLGKAKFFTLIDLEKGFHQIPMNEEDKGKTAFYTHKGLYEYNVMPFGVRNGPATFQRFIDEKMEDIIRKFIEAFIDDLLIYSETLEEHLLHIKELLKRLREAGLTIHPNKIKVCVQEIKYLGTLFLPDM